MRVPTILRACLFTLAAAGVGSSAVAQNYDRIITASDITYTLSPVPGGGWIVRATVWLANESPVPLDMGCELVLSVNGRPVSNTVQTVMVSNAGTGGSGCGTSCVTDGWCAACKESIIVPGTCYCCNHSVSTEITVPTLSPGDVITAYAVALPGAAVEIAGANDGAFVVVPVPGGANRAVKPTGVHYGRTASGAYALAGEVDITMSGDGLERNLSYTVLVMVNGHPYGGGGGGGGGCGGGTFRLISAQLGQMIGTTPPQFFCADFCLRCTINFQTGTPSGNVCDPPGTPPPPSGNPLCMCHDNCSGARIVPGLGWQVEVPQLNPADEVAVVVSPFPGSVPEFDTSDDATVVRVADITLCSAILADLGRQGGLPGGDGQFDNNDFIVFIGHFFDADPRADLGSQGGLFGPDGHYDNNDFIVFIDAFFAGC